MVLKYKRQFGLAIVLSLATLVGLGAASDAPGPWVQADSPMLSKESNLSVGTALSSSNHDCTKITTRTYGSAQMQDDCVVQTALGMVGYNFIFSGTSEAIPVVNNMRSARLKPVPNQGVYYTHSKAPLLGQYMQFYRSVRDKMKPLPELVNSEWQYVLNKGPDFGLQDNTGRALPVNTLALAFSKNGNWMIADIPFQGFVRVNMATFEVTPFAPSMNQGSDYSSHTAQLSISNDGRYAAIKPLKYDEFRVYDMDRCGEAVLPVEPLKPKCVSRDYWPYLKTNIPQLKTVYKVRFWSTHTMGFTATTHYIDGSNFQAAEYTLAAPGETSAGIEYLGMGDSFAAGQGAFNYILGTDTDINRCHLSALSYPFLISSLLYSSGHSVACSGAKIRDISDASENYEGQVRDDLTKKDRIEAGFDWNTFLPGYLVQNDFVDRYNPQTVTISIGGNDIGFADIVKQCVMPRLKNTTCFPAYEDQQELVKRITAAEDRLKNTYTTISKPGRSVYVIGYPQIVVSGGNCAANVHLNEDEIKLFIGLTDVMNQTIRRAADAAGVHYVDVSKAFEHHRMCETDSRQVAVNGFTLGNDDGLKKLKFIGSESYHPNALGHELLKQAVLGQTQNLKLANVAPTIPSPITTSLPYPTAPKTGRTPSISVYDASIVPDVITPATPIALNVGTETALLKPSSLYTIRLNDGVSLGNVTTDIAGSLPHIIQIPGTVPCGYHTFHLNGPNLLGQTIDISKVVYVDDCASSEYISPCGPIAGAGVDEDKDGIDDACDAVISDPPKPPDYQVYLTGISIHATKRQ